MRRYHNRQQRLTKFVERDLAQHKMTEAAPCRAWTFQRVTDGRAQWCPCGFKLIWTPGMFQLMGDIGELTITHYHAIGSDLRAGLEWLHDGEFDYLAGKSNVRQRYDMDATTVSIWDCLVEASREHLQAYREDMREWRDLCAEMRVENAVLHADNKLPDCPERPEEIDQPFRRLAHAMEVHYSETDPKRGGAWRKRLLRMLPLFLDTEQDAADLSCELFGDPIVTYEWPQSVEMQIAAMRWAADVILKAEFEELQPEASRMRRLIDWIAEKVPMRRVFG